MSRPAGFKSAVSVAELFPGHDDWRPEAVKDLSGAGMNLRLEAGRLHLSFTEGEVRWETDADLPELTGSGSADYEAIPLRDGLVGAVFEDDSRGGCLFLILDLKDGRALLVATQMQETDGAVKEQTRLLDAVVGEQPEAHFPDTNGLVGKRIQWRYSDTHSFEHIYLEPHIYCWHGIEGPEEGIGGVEPTWTREIATDLFLLVWSEITGMPFSGAVLIDLAHAPRAKSSGRLVGWDDDKHRPRQIIVGAEGKVVNETSYDNV